MISRDEGSGLFALVPEPRSVYVGTEKKVMW